MCACSGLETPAAEKQVKSAEVVISVGSGTQTRTAYDADSRGFVWQAADRIGLWAKSASGAYTLSGTQFSLLAANKAQAYFTATLSSPMEAGTYTYYAAYPAPGSIYGTKATFSLPAEQDGAATGVDILVSDAAAGAALQPLAEAQTLSQESPVAIKMHHLLHFLRFYFPEGGNNLGEPLSRIEFSMPQNVAGQVSVDVTDPSLVSLADGSNDMTLKLTVALDEGGEAVAAIFPPETAYGAGDRMQVNIYSDNKWASLEPLPLEGRTFEAGHITPVPMRAQSVKSLYTLLFKLSSNNLGEDPQSITMTLPDGLVWPGTASSTLSWRQEGGIAVGATYSIKTGDEAAFRALSKKSVNITYESQSAVVSETVTLADLSSTESALCALNCPYLFFEDFSGVESFNSGDKHSGSNVGSKTPTVFNGWSVARGGAQNGTAIRLAAHREWFANYPARCDSPFLSGLKEGKTVSLDIQFNYSMGREEGGLGSGTNASQTVYLGYITTSDNLSSGDDTGSWTTDFTVNETTGSYYNINHLSQSTLTDVCAPLRLSWRTTTPTYSSTTNSTCWLYIDNIKVKIKK